MEISANRMSLSTEERSKLYSNGNTVENQNRESAENSAKIVLTGDVVDIRSSAVFTGESLDRSNLVEALEQLTAQLLGNEQEAFTAQGNLGPSSVLALLED
jgi:hypothetical protein